jgi:hypothetical protein
VETLLERGADGDVAEAEAAIERLAAAPTDEGLVLRDRFDHLRRKHERQLAGRDLASIRVAHPSTSRARLCR